MIPIYKIQHADKNAHINDYSHLRDDELLVSTIFRTCQGEGPYSGWPCVFVRLAGCNFGSKEQFCGFCDTDFRLVNAHRMKIGEILYEAKKLWNEKEWQGQPLMVITGGEPTLQMNLITLMERAKEQHWITQIETNGTQVKFANALKERKTFTTVVISPKASEHGYGAEPKHYKDWNSYLKFVVDANPDSVQNVLPDWVDNWSAERVYISPMAIYESEYQGEVADAWQEGLVNRESTRRNYAYAFELCMEFGYKLTLQQHLWVKAP